MSLEEALEDNWPPSRVIAECGECGGVLLDTDKERPSGYSAVTLSSHITTFALKHREKSGHDDVEVTIDIHLSTPVKEIDATITIND